MTDPGSNTELRAPQYLQAPTLDLPQNSVECIKFMIHQPVSYHPPKVLHLEHDRPIWRGSRFSHAPLGFEL